LLSTDEVSQDKMLACVALLDETWWILHSPRQWSQANEEGDGFASSSTTNGMLTRAQWNSQPIVHPSWNTRWPNDDLSTSRGSFQLLLLYTFHLRTKKTNKQTIQDYKQAGKLSPGGCFPCCQRFKTHGALLLSTRLLHH
jgi:hypothetical protein